MLRVKREDLAARGVERNGPDDGVRDGRPVLDDGTVVESATWSGAPASARSSTGSTSGGRRATAGRVEMRGVVDEVPGPVLLRLDLPVRVQLDGLPGHRPRRGVRRAPDRRAVTAPAGAHRTRLSAEPPYPPDEGGGPMGVVEDLARAREAYDRRDWVAAYDGSLAADATALRPRRLRRSGHRRLPARPHNDCIQALQRAYRAHLDAGETRRRGPVAPSGWRMALLTSGEPAVGERLGRAVPTAARRRSRTTSSSAATC